MPMLSPFWSAAVALTGRLDLSGLPDGVDPGSLPAAELARHGVGAHHARRLVGGAAPLAAPRFVRWIDAEYPEQLRRVPHAPPVLFFEGHWDTLAAPLVAIVGARRASGDGLRMARHLAASVAGAGGVVVSGLAQGVDSAAHAAAGGRTIAVLGQGLGRPLPGARGRLRRAMLDAGALLLSELPPDRPASRATFPMRNRIIAGLARLTVVVEARVRSGARITARNALEAGRDVMAVPGHPLRAGMEGCLRLIQEGAGVVTDAQDVLDAAGLQAPPARMAHDPLLDAVGSGADFDTLLRRTGLSPTHLIRELSARELTGSIIGLPGGRYARATR